MPDVTLEETGALRGRRLWAAAVVLAVANFMAVLDTAVANVALPSIAGGLGVSPTDGTWVITSYSIAEAVSVPLTGWIAARFGPARALIPAMAGFGLFSALCGSATSLSGLVVMRILQGLCGGPMIPLSQTLLRTIFPKERLGLGLGLWSMTTLLAPIAGPILGGHLSDNAGWQWIFFINVPIAIGCSIAALFLLKPVMEPGRQVGIDWIGLLLLVVWVGSLQMLLDNGKDLDWFNSGFIRGLAATSLVGFLAFLIWELTEEEPIVDLRLFRSRGFTAATLTLSMTFAAFFSSIVLLPLWLQTVMGYTASLSGYALASSGIVAVVVSPIVATQVGRLDNRILVSIGLAVMIGVSVLRAGFDTEVDFLHISLVGTVQGFGMGFLFAPLNNMALAALKPQQVAAGSGLLNFSRTMSASFATSLTVSLWTDIADRVRTPLLEHMTPFNPQGADALATLGEQGTKEQALARLSGIVDAQAIMVATDHMFAISAGLFATAALLVWLVPRRAEP